MEISLDKVKKYLDTSLILERVTFNITDGERVGIVGENGSGKTTILKLIAGILTMNHCAGYPYAPVPPGFDEGWVNTPKNATIAYLDQIPEFPIGTRVIDVLKSAFTEIYQLEAEIRELENNMRHIEGVDLERTLRKYSEKVSLFELKEGYNVEEKLNRVCKGLHFSEEFLTQDFNMLSGGEKTTVTLGKLLIDMPDVLLLDEPTNHLDMESVEWLEDYLKTYKGIVIVVSHDRYFLDNVVNKVIEIEDKESDTFIGNYSSYLTQKDEKLRIQLENYMEQNKKIKSMEQAVKQLRDWAARADNVKFYKRAASMQLKLDKMERLDKPTDRQNMKLNFKQADRSGRITISAKDLSKSFGQKTLFHNAKMEVYFGERVALIGPNGSGKTTFLKMLLGEEMPDAGKVELGASVMQAYLPQNVTFENDEMTALEYFRDDISILEGKAREYLAKFLFYGNNVFKKIKLLSGGERLRLMLAKLLYKDINLLILDEPTNHLDTRSIESIEEALDAFKGTILFISHDRYFINKISNRVIAIEDEGLHSYLGNYDYYKSIKDKERRQGEEELKAVKQEKKAVKEGQSAKAVKAEKDKQDGGKKTVKKSVDAAKTEKRIEELEAEIQKIDEMMVAMGSDYEELNSLYERKVELSKELEQAMEEWLAI
ncbi:MAG: ABC-F type ribosomal protection protein [Clostridiales bacterium]|jgi:ATPase subunit of ABC transporter with duplicated ATPase domains|nr:ABC-F type ribosomal protection protein [Clostridiales bacterium]